MTVPTNEITRSMLRNGLLLGLFAVVTVGLVAVVHQATAERIEQAGRDAQSRTLGEILPAGSYDNQLLDSTVQAFDPELLGKPTPQPAYLATLAGQPSAVILQASAPDGYSGAIHLLVAVQADGRLAGVRVVKHNETPGLGDKIELAKSDWIRTFEGRALGNPDDAGWTVRKDGGHFDQFAGATITPRAVTRAVHRALQYFDKHRDELLATRKDTNG
ncbi:electron transport complex subunit RsxG [Zestomonas carbonaria]|uniref:Ion-translocating oxidoreductase complex subunit G n=1 Tax=Zestomonas carbonaria TaxID=2762745 RepID=A0A7U7ER61_9GAMM|nr:electron transport complex subunit RsxG [Pseudomonas carbonaria]CAD5109207.1 Ion-translocating oxidoreductase complex subunit G [Pseudomonas carbonaria]